MAGRGRATASDPGSVLARRRKAWRFSLWLGVTAVAVGAAALSAYSEAGAHRSVQTASLPTPAATPRAESDVEMRRLSETVRALVADRDRLAARLAALEHNLDDVTGSIPNQAVGERFPAGATATQPMQQTATGAPSRAPDGAGSNAAPVPPPVIDAANAPLGPAGSVATRTEFGIDLGSAPTMDGLRNLWTSVKNGHDPLLQGLHPVVTVRDGSRPGSVELRLVAGPLANASAAARLCAALATAGLTCQPAVFDGQRLALK